MIEKLELHMKKYRFWLDKVLAKNLFEADNVRDLG